MKCASAHPRLHHARYRHIDREAEDVFHFLLKSDYIEDCPFGVQVDEEVDIALRSLLSASDGPEYAKISDSVSPGRR